MTTHFDRPARSLFVRVVARIVMAATALAGSACGLDEICNNPTFTVTDASAVGALPTEYCDAAGDCPHLRAALNTANFCRDNGAKTVVLPSGGHYVISDANVSTVYERRRDESAIARIGSQVGLPHIFNDITIEGNGSFIEIGEEASGIRHFHVSPGYRLTLHDLTLSGAKQVLQGGAVFNEGLLETRDASFEMNHTLSRGGAIYNGATGRVDARDTMFLLNQGKTAVAIMDVGPPLTADGECPALEDPSLVLHRSVLSEHVSLGIHGGAVLRTGTCSDAVISDTTFHSNDTVDGVIRNRGRLLIEASTLSHNRGIEQGGLWAEGGQTLVDSSTFSQNEGRSRAAILCGSIPGARLSLIDVTVSDNRVLHDFGATLTATSECELTVSNTIVGENVGADCGFAGDAISDAFSADSDGTCAGFDATLPLPLGLGSLQPNGGPTLTMLPSFDSPVVDLGDRCFSLDQRGEPRPVGNCDLGAVERQETDPLENG